MRKEILFKKGIITALTVAMVTSLAPAIGAGGLKTITAKAEETESHNYNSQGFCTECDAYQSAVLTTDKYDIDDDNSKDDVYEIGNAGQLFWFAGLVNGTLDGVKQNKLANAVLTANITVNENLLDSLQYDAEGNVSNGSDFISWTPIADWMGNRTTQ